MFQFNFVGKLLCLIGCDVYVREFYLDLVDCLFGVVNFEVGFQKMSVCVDSFVLCGVVDEIVVKCVKILVVFYVMIEVGDKFQFDGMNFWILSKYMC